MKMLGWASVFSALLMAGCVAVQQQQVLSVPTPPGRVAMLPTQPLSARIFNKTVAAGSTATLNSATSLNPDCTLIALPTPRVTQAPSHGTVRFLQEEAFPAFQRGNPHAHCNGMRAPSIVAGYTPAPGFIGTDFAALEFIFRDGRDVPVRYAITVK